MADNVEINAGSGTTVSTEEVTTLNGGAVSAQHLQRIAAAIRTADGTAVDLPGDSTNGLDVDVTRVGGTVTVSATDLDIRALSSGTDSVAVTDGGGALTVDGTVTANLAAGTNNIGDVDVLTIAAGDNNIGNVDIVTVPAPLSTTGGGTEATAHRVTIASDSTGVLSVDDNNSSLTVDQATASNLNAQVIGAVATDGALSTNNPVITGGRASTAVPTAVNADGDAVNIWANRNGAPVVTQAPHVGLNGTPWSLLSVSAQYTTTQTSTALVTVSTEIAVVTCLQIQATGTTGGAVQVYFGTGAYSRGTTRAIFDGSFIPSATSYPGVVMNGPFIAGTGGDDIRVTTSAAINSLTVTCWYYLIA